MNLDELRNYCLQKKGTTEELPFGPDTLVFKVKGKIFAICGMDDEPLSVNLKSEPEKALELRERWPENVLPAYHQNKMHWNTVVLQWPLPESQIRSMIDNSYALVVKGLKKADRKDLEK